MAAVGILTRQHISRDSVHTAGNIISRELLNFSHSASATNSVFLLHVVGDLREAAMLSAGLQSFQVKPVEAAVQ